MDTSLSENHITAPAPALIMPEMAGAIYLGTFRPASGGKVPVLDKASREAMFEGTSGNAADWRRRPQPRRRPRARGPRAVLPALAMGNAEVLKPDLQTPVCGG